MVAEVGLVFLFEPCRFERVAWQFHVYTHRAERNFDITLSNITWSSQHKHNSVVRGILWIFWERSSCYNKTQLHHTIISKDVLCDNESDPVSLTVFPSQFEFHGNFVSLSLRFYSSDRYQILYVARQPCCGGMCKTLLWFNGQQRSYSKAKFPSNLNCGKIVSETGP